MVGSRSEVPTQETRSDGLLAGFGSALGWSLGVVRSEPAILLDVAITGGAALVAIRALRPASIGAEGYRRLAVAAVLLLASWCLTVRHAVAAERGGAPLAERLRTAVERLPAAAVPGLLALAAAGGSFRLLTNLAARLDHVPRIAVETVGIVLVVTAVLWISLSAIVADGRSVTDAVLLGRIDQRGHGVTIGLVWLGGYNFVGMALIGLDGGGPASTAALAAVLGLALTGGQLVATWVYLEAS